MTTIRNNVFETNSSSMHAIVIPRIPPKYVSNFRGQITFDLSINFSEKCFVERNDIESKAAYAFHLLVNEIVRKLPNQLSKGYSPIQFDTLILYRKKFINILKRIEQHYTYDGLSVKFVNYEFKINPDKGFVSIVGNSGHNIIGKYDDAILNVLGIDQMADMIHREIMDNDISIDDEFNCDFYSLFDNLIDFILNKKAAILQGYDEMSQEEIKKQLKAVKKYVNKNNGSAFVIWPEEV